MESSWLSSDCLTSDGIAIVKHLFRYVNLRYTSADYFRSPSSSHMSGTKHCEVNYLILQRNIFFPVTSLHTLWLLRFTRFAAFITISI
ncbi:unnamed protein product [Urochloa humidicola]